MLRGRSKIYKESFKEEKEDKLTVSPQDSIISIYMEHTFPVLHWHAHAHTHTVCLLWSIRVRPNMIRKAKATAWNDSFLAKDKVQL